MESKKKADTKPCCGNCINFDDGICDFAGYVVEVDDEPRCSKRGWEPVNE